MMAVVFPMAQAAFASGQMAVKVPARGCQSGLERFQAVTGPVSGAIVPTAYGFATADWIKMWRVTHHLKTSKKTHQKKTVLINCARNWAS